ncbi:MAG TPA: hypothetical protein VF280_18925 [Burkholderiales bacterium]|jgi:hypothetical protein
MQYDIDMDEEFLRVQMSGRDTDRPPSEVCALVLAESRKRNRKRILIELDQKVPLSPTSQYRLVTNLPKLGFTTEERIALVHRAPEHQNAAHFITLLGRNHDVMVRNFTTLDAAKAWLRGADA